MKKKHPGLSLLPAYCITLAFFLLLGYFCNTAVTVMQANAPIQRNICVVIDAGHGGVDGGASTAEGIPESRINLQIALRLNDLMHLLGIQTKMIRTTDISIHTQGQTIAAKKVSDLRQRVRIVNETKNAFLISIHQNYFSDSRYSGAQTFYANSAVSRDFAKQLQTSLIQCLNPGSHRKAKPADGIYLMQNIQKDGVLIECGFLSNPAESALLNSAEYQKQLSCVIATQTSRYFQNPADLT